MLAVNVAANGLPDGHALGLAADLDHTGLDGQGLGMGRPGIVLDNAQPLTIDGDLAAPSARGQLYRGWIFQGLRPAAVLAVAGHGCLLSMSYPVSRLDTGYAYYSGKSSASIKAMIELAKFLAHCPVIARLTIGTTTGFIS